MSSRPERPTSSRQGTSAAKIILVLAAIGGTVAAIKMLPLDQYLLGLVGWIRNAGLAGVVIYVVV